MSAPDARSTLGIYVHLPFCSYLCPYCDFAKWPLRASSAQQYLAALYAELQSSPREPAATIFLGGGTPNAYDAQAIAQLLCRLQEHFPAPVEEREITIEINPELVREGDFDRYRKAGVTRVSIGVQSFEEREIAVLGRKHSFEDVRSAVAGARVAGIASISIDLIFAVPSQTRESWCRSIDRALALGIDHVSAYALTVEEGTPFAAWRRREPAAFFDDTREAELYAIAIRSLQAAGYEQYEISNFARQGHRCKHNQNYWANGEYLGLGVGAASYRSGERSVHTRSLQVYIDAALSGNPVPSEAERLDGLKRTGEAIMLALRTAQGVGLQEFKERYGIDVLEHYAPIVSRFSRAGLLERTDEFMRLTERGRFVANDVCGAFVTFD
ncbi:MAG: radical SAM family heme chaperone HemW [Candidatus Eremiobacteraeota bacterium]|nr:radical SAM family heme chaperone HemW [Candidatus Eremiobacteraeota bacterium]